MKDFDDNGIYDEDGFYDYTDDYTSDDYQEYSPSFIGPCTCPHEESVHGWIGCEMEECPCGAHWEE